MEICAVTGVQISEHEYQIECPSCSRKTTVGYAFTARNLIDDLTNKKD
jgi:hypothetical protein